MNHFIGTIIWKLYSTVLEVSLYLELPSNDSKCFWHARITSPKRDSTSTFSFPAAQRHVANILRGSFPARWPTAYKLRGGLYVVSSSLTFGDFAAWWWTNLRSGITDALCRAYDTLQKFDLTSFHCSYLTGTSLIHCFEVLLLIYPSTKNLIKMESTE
jgi:hypothetical protein